MVRKADDSVRKSMEVPASRFSRPPEGLKNILIIPQTTMMEMKKTIASGSKTPSES